MPESVELQEALVHCRKMIRIGSKSFSLAARLLRKDSREAAFMLYGWCRYIDDAIDEAAKYADREVLERRLAELREQTLAAYSDTPATHPIFVAFQYVVKKYQIPSHYPLELLEGMGMDIRRERYARFEDLLLYCYRVAGTVGLMMTHIMGTYNDSALQHASDMGIAMQLTNIARDITDDAAIGRIYLPLGWLEDAGVQETEFTDPKNRARVSVLVSRLLNRAEEFYRFGDDGLIYLAFRPACAASAARLIYAEIGQKVRELGPRAWDNRVWVSRPRKLVLLCLGFLTVMKTIPQRMKRHWKRRPIQTIWKHASV